MFLWAVLSALYPATHHVDRLSNYLEFAHELDDAMKGTEYPVSIRDIPKFEKRSGVSINVYGYGIKSNKPDVYPLLISKNKQDRHVNLLCV